MVARVGRAVAILPLIGIVTSASPQSPRQRTEAFATSSATRVISPAVLVTWVTRGERDGYQVLDLLVLWRGTPGWFTEGTSSGSSSGGSANAFHTTVRYGGLELELSLDTRTRVARVQGQEIKLEDANVVLVDRVDSQDGLEVVGTMRVDPEMPEGPKRIEPVLRRSPDLLAFLRCDARVPDPKVKGMLDLICAQVLGK